MAVWLPGWLLWLLTLARALPRSLLANGTLPPHSCGLFLLPGEDSEFLGQGRDSCLSAPSLCSGVPHSIQAPDGLDVLVALGVPKPPLSLPLTCPPHPTSTPDSQLGPVAAPVLAFVSAQMVECVLSKDGGWLPPA